MYSVVALAILGTFFGLRSYRNYQKNSVKNFKPVFAAPVGWVNEPHGPTTLFKFADPSTKLVLRGAVNQMISDYNPTPDLDTAGIAKFYLERTKQSMPDWTGKDLGDYSTHKGNSYEVIRRATKDRVVVTAYWVRGNTTLLISLFGKDKSGTFTPYGHRIPERSD